jgi:hypothetical protein
MKRLACCWLAALLAACVPATPPPISHTPGPSVVIDGEAVRTDVFSAEVPEGWRVITGAADAPLSLILVAPGDCALIRLTVESINVPPEASGCADQTRRAEVRAIEAGGVTVYAGGGAPVTEWDSFLRDYELVVASLVIRPES